MAASSVAASPSPTVAAGRPRRQVTVRPHLLAAIFVGGCAGGLARYGLTLALPPSGGWPWGILVANTAGAFLLAALLVLLLELWTAPPWVRPALGTGLLGAFTTMSSVVVTVDVLVVDARLATAAGFLTASMVTGLVAAGLGLALGRAVVVFRHAARKERDT